MGKRRTSSGIVIPWERGSAVWSIFRGRTVKIVVVTTATVLAFVWVFLHDAERARVRETRASITELTRAVDGFRADVGRCPTSLAELARPRDTGSAALREIPRDGWGRPFDLICPGRKNPDSADIRSMGPDGTWFGMDEID